MRPAAGAILLAACLAATWAATAEARAETVSARVSAFLDQARAAESEKDAEKAFLQAERLLLAAGADLGEVARAFLEADVQRTRGQRAVDAWRRDPTRTASRQEGRRLLLAARAVYERLKGQAEDEANRIADRAGPTADPSADPRYREADGNVSRATYSLAWAQYHLALAAEDPAERAKLFDAAIETFRAFTDEGYRDHPIIAECFLGQALCLHEKGEAAGAVRLLEPANAGNTPRGVFRQMTLLRVRAAQAGGPSPRKVEDAAAPYFDSLPPDYRLDAADLALAMERARALERLADPGRNSDDYAACRARLGAFKGTIYAYGDPWAAELAKVLGESPPPSAAGILKTAVEHYEAKRFKEALAAAEAGLRTTPGKSGPVAADLQYMKVASLMSLERWREAHLAAAEFLQAAPKDPRSPDVCRRAFLAGLKALKADPPLDQAALDQFVAFARTTFPDVPEVQDAPWARASQLLAAGQYREAEAALKDVPPGSPSYRRAQYGLALAAYKQAEQALEGGASGKATAAGHLGRAAAAVRRFVESLPADMPEADRPMADHVAGIGVAAARRMLDLPEPDLKGAAAMLDLLQRWPAPGPQVEPQRRALQMAIAVRSGRPDEVLREVDAALAAAKPQDPKTAQVLASAADPLEEQSGRLAKEGKPAAARKIDERLLRVYESLLAGPAEGPDAPLRGKTVTIRRRLAHVLLRLDRPKDAIGHYEWVLEHVPREKAGDVLRGLALAREKVHRYDEAVEPWNALAKGLREETDGWFEARYHLILCHWEAGRWDHARRLMAYFRTSRPQGAPGEWKARFDALHERMEKVAGGAPSNGAPRP